MTKYAVLIPCLNESSTIASVIRDAKHFIPEAIIYVYDNGSTDNSIEIAKRSGAIVRSISARGKGSVIRRMFQEIDADIYVMVDGDMTYDLARIPDMISELENHSLDMVIGARIHSDKAAYRSFHRLGNQFLTGLVRFLFKSQTTDMLSGFRVLTKEFVKKFPALSDEFELETELTIFAARGKFTIKEINTAYHPRPMGSISKLSTYKDGFKILKMIIRLYLAH